MEQMMSYFHYVFTAILIGMWAYTYIFILMDAGKILVGWWKFMNDWEQSTYDYNAGKWGWRKWFASKINQPLIHCGHCHAGQVAFWAYFINYGWDWSTYSVWWHVGYITIAIIIVELLINLRTWMNRKQR